MPLVNTPMPLVVWDELTEYEVIEPVEAAPDKPKTLRIVVTYDPTTQAYTARWGNTADYETTAPSAATALRYLANRFDDAGMHGSNTEMMADLSRKADVLCKYCYAPIFFAKLPPPSSRWLSFDPEPIEASKIAPIRSARFSATGDRLGRPQVLWQPPRAAGPCWVPHPECCGGKEEAPLNPVLKARWKERRQFSLDKKAKVVDGLREIVQDINEGILNVE